VAEHDSLRVQLRLQGFQHLLTHKGTFPYPSPSQEKKKKKKNKPQNHQKFLKKN